MPISVEHWGGIICNFTPILLYFQLWGMNLDHDFVQVSKLSEDQKKRSSPKMEHFFSPSSSGHLRSDAHQSQIIGRDADVYHTQTIGGDTAKLLGDISPPPGFGIPAKQFVEMLLLQNKQWLVGYEKNKSYVFLAQFIVW